MISSSWKLIYDTFTSWNEDRAPRLGAALAFYTILSLAPLLLIVIGIVGLIFDKSAISAQITDQLSQNIGAEGAATVTKMLDAANNRRGSGPLAIVIGFGASLIAANGLFAQLQDALNTIWNVKLKAGLPFTTILRTRFISFTMVFSIGFVLLVSLVLSTAVAAVTRFLPAGAFAQSATFLGAFLVTTLLFALIFKVLPDAQVQWRDVWIGAVLTSVLFSIGRFALGFYFARQTGNLSVYGPASSLVLILLWVYYASQILFFGAEFTKVYANSFGSKIKPEAYAEAISTGERATQGLQPEPTKPGAKAATPPVSSASAASQTPKPSMKPSAKPSQTPEKFVKAPPFPEPKMVDGLLSPIGHTPEENPLPPRPKRRGSKFDDVAALTLGVGAAFMLFRVREARREAKHRKRLAKIAEKRAQKRR